MNARRCWICGVLIGAIRVHFTHITDVNPCPGSWPDKPKMKPPAKEPASA